LTNLGLGGQCHLDPTVAMVIRDRPADLITLKLGVNCVISGSLNARTFPAAITGMVSIIRERQPLVPIGLVSPIMYPSREKEPNAVGCTMRDVRDAIRDVCQRLTDAGDRNLSFYDGLQIFGRAEMEQYSADQCHPDADGIEVLAEAFDRIVMSDLMSRIRG